MRILVDGRILCYRQARGMTFYLKHMLEEMSKKDRKNEYFILTGRAPMKVSLEMGENFKIIKFLSVPGVDELFTIPMFIRRLKPDVLWFPSSVAPLFIPGKPGVISTIHDLIFLRSRERIFTYKWLGALYRKIFVKRAVNKSHRIMADSKTVATQIEEVYKAAKGKVRVAYPGIPEHNCFDDSILMRFSLKPGFYVYSITGTGSNKNIERLLKALPVFLIRNKRYRFVITGVPERETEHSDIVFTGYISGCEKNTLLRNAALFVLISTEEGFGFPALEAASFGVPLLLSDIPVFRELYGEIATFVNPFSVEDICFGMERALERPITYFTPEILDRFSWERAADVLLEEFSSVSP